MDNELTNLLPRDRQKTLSRDYILRAGTVAAVLAAILIFSSAVLLVPTYIFLRQTANTIKIDLARIDAALSSSDEAALSERLAKLSANAASLTSISKARSVSTVIREILSIPRPGITLSGVSFAPSGDKSSETAIVSGTSATRDSLRSYQLALQGAPFALSAILPVSAYAKDSNIAFAITITLAP